jgi:hypothetical protein
MITTMRPLSLPNIESELSYAYLHAVASKAGMSCRDGNRHEDNNGIDAQLTAWLPYVDANTLTEVDIKVQLKATIAVPTDDGSNYEYRLQGANRYNDLRSETISFARILVVLFLPRDAEEWLHHTPDQLVLRRCGYWQSLRGAPEITAASAVVKLPKTQHFSPDSLTQLAVRLSRRDFPLYPSA